LFELRDADFLAELDIHSKVLTASEVHDLEPFAGDGIVGGVHFPGDCHLNPPAFVSGLAWEAEKAGVVIYENTHVLGFETSNRSMVRPSGLYTP
jgi:D-amino-acid dehydrogenase